jgi:hypothetical protein
MTPVSDVAPGPLVSFLWLSLPWRGPGPLFEQTWIPLSQG